MLETIRNQINQAMLSNTSFEEYYNLYIMSVQDNNIRDEVKFNIRHINYNTIDIERLAQAQHERLVKTID